MNLNTRQALRDAIRILDRLLYGGTPLSLRGRAWLSRAAGRLWEQLHVEDKGERQ